MVHELFNMIKTIAKQKAHCDVDEFCADDFAAGNIDDAYNGGFSDGQIELARDILYKIKISKKE